MAQDSKIEWTDHTVNLWIGCTHVHEGCDNCYAEALAKRWGNDLWGNDKPRKYVVSALPDLGRYQRQAEKAERVDKIFLGSLMDIGEKSMPLINSKGQPMIVGARPYETGQVRTFFFEEIVPVTPNLLYLFLSKRPSNYNKIIPESWKQNPPENVMFGTSVVNQGTFNTLVPQLKQVNGKRFLSIEPQLGPIFNPDLSGIDWVIQGGESGPKKRPFNTDWARAMKYQCQIQGVPYFFKQIDKVQPIPDDLKIRQFPE